MPLIAATPRHATVVLFINVFINLYVIRICIALEDTINNRGNEDITRGKYISILELILSLVGCIIAEENDRTFVKKLMKHTVLVLVLTILIVNSLIVFALASGLPVPVPKVPEKAHSGAQNQTDLLLLGSFVLYFDFVFKIFTIFIVSCFGTDFASMINSLPDDNTSEQNVLLDNEETALPPSYEECVQTCEPPAYSEINKAETE